jgi:hypothetical protein
MEIENPWLMRAFTYCNPLAVKGLKTAKTIKNDIEANFEHHMIVKKKVLQVNYLLTIECSRED